MRYPVIAFCVLFIMVAAKPLAAQQLRRDSMVYAGDARFTVLSATLIRMEYSPERPFVDLPSLVAINRDNWEPVEFDVLRDGPEVIITTERLSLVYQPGSGGFSARNLHIELLGTAPPIIWHAGLENTDNLGGTLDSLNGVTGRESLDDGVLSRVGWYVLDDSNTPVFTSDNWPQPREGRNSEDKFFFGYGYDYIAGLRDFNNLTGPLPMLPRWAFGVWLSSEWPHAQEEFKFVIDSFANRNVPLSALLLSFWQRYSWAGYDWAVARFPDPRKFLEQSNQAGVQIGLNIYPGSALLPRDSHYKPIIERIGVTRILPEMVFFDFARIRDVNAYFNVIISPLEQLGVDFWWVSSGAANTMRHMDRQWWTDHLFFTRTRRRPKRSIILSPYGGIGSHRYPVGHSGDITPSWELLDFLVPFTTTAGNAGMAYWSHNTTWDGGISDELMTRWMQFTVFSPIFRLHSSEHLNNLRERGEEQILRATELLQMRRAFIPYFYTLSSKAHTEGLPLCRPMYLHYPRDNEAYQFDRQFLLGENLLVAPITTPIAEGKRTVKTIWFPPGIWFDIFNGTIVEGGTVLTYSAELEQIPIFARRGTIIPSAEDADPDLLVLDVFTGDSGEFVLYEDDGETLGYLDGQFAQAVISYTEDEQVRTVRIGTLDGVYDGKPDTRRYRIRLHTILPTAGVAVDGRVIASTDAQNDRVGWYYDPERGLTTVHTPPLPTDRPVEVVFTGDFRRDELELAYTLRSLLPRLESAAVLLEDDPELLIIVQRLREAAERARERALALARTRLRPSEALQALEAVRRELADVVNLANVVMPDNALKIDLMQVLTGITLRSRIEDTPYRQIVIHTDLDFLAHGWGTVTGHVQVNDLVPQRVRMLRPEQSAYARVEIPIGAIELRPITYRVTANLLWNDIPLNLVLDNILDNSYLRQFYVIGPFGNGGYRRLLEQAFPPESNVELAASYTGKMGHTIGWRLHPWRAPAHDDDELMIDLGRYLDRAPPAAGYAYTRVYVPETTSALMNIRGPGGIAIWLNETPIFRQLFMQFIQPDEESVNVTLESGWNDILVKVIDEGQHWGFSLQLRATDGTPIPGAISGWGPGFEEYMVEE